MRKSASARQWLVYLGAGITMAGCSALVGFAMPDRPPAAIVAVPQAPSGVKPEHWGLEIHGAPLTDTGSDPDAAIAP